MEAAGESVLRVLVATRSERVRRLAGSLTAVALGVLLVLHPFVGRPHEQVTGRIVGVAAIGLFGWNAFLVARSMRARPGRLELTQSGFHIVGARSERFVPWSLCSAFTVGRRRSLFRPPAPFVMFDETSGGATKALGRFGATDARAYGFSSLLPSSYGMRRPELAALMNRCRENALRGAAILDLPPPSIRAPGEHHRPHR